MKFKEVYVDLTVVIYLSVSEMRDRRNYSEHHTFNAYEFFVKRARKRQINFKCF